MHYKTKDELLRKIGLFGLSDLRRLAPIGDLDYANGWKKAWMNGGMESAIMKAFWEQKEKYGWTLEDRSSGWPCDHTSYCPQLGLMWSVDSSG